MTKICSNSATTPNLGMDCAIASKEVKWDYLVQQKVEVEMSGLNITIQKADQQTKLKDLYIASHNKSIQPDLISNISSWKDCSQQYFLKNFGKNLCPRPECTSHGECFMGICFCFDGWLGLNCEMRAPKCPNNCSNTEIETNGHCLSNDTCTCIKPWCGFDCSKKCCPKDCCHHGACLPNGKCKCGTKWKGADCCVPIEEVCPNDCTGHGNCIDNTCQCFRKWRGVDCSIYLETCPDDYFCTNGKCNGQGHCDCDLGYTGDDCSLGPFYFDEKTRPSDSFSNGPSATDTELSTGMFSSLLQTAFDLMTPQHNTGNNHLEYQVENANS